LSCRIFEREWRSGGVWVPNNYPGMSIFHLSPPSCTLVNSPCPVQTSYMVYMRNRNDSANKQAHGSTPMPHYTNYSIKRSGKISPSTNATPTETNYVDTLIISIPKSNSPNMRNTTRMSNRLGSMNLQTNGQLLVKMEVLLWLGGLYPLLDLLPRLIFPLWME
jgi:hypothetical protein